MRKRISKRTLLAFALTATVMLSACSNDDSGENETAPEAAAEVPVEAIDTPAIADADAVAEGDEGGETGPAIVAIYELNDWYRAITLDEEAVADPADLEMIGREICEGMAPCRAAMWFDASLTPRGFPVEEVVLRDQVFAFGRTMDGDENVLWNCDYFPQFEAERKCLPRPMD